MPNLSFLKMHGCGNDFVVFDDPQNSYSWEQLAALAIRVCDRRFGIGADGLIAIGATPLPGDTWGENADYEMRYLNADGSRAEMCGNGIRCVGKFVAEELGDNRGEVRIQTGNGVLPLRLIHDGKQVAKVSVSMGVPRLSASDVPMLAEAQINESYSGLTRLHLPVGSASYEITGVSMGNPHAVIFVDEITDGQVLGDGPLIEADRHFPRKTNVEFVKVESPTRLRMRVWERGCGETWACGTGACASAVAAIMTGRSKEDSDIVLALNGGELIINWGGEGRPVIMTGPAETVFRGELAL